MKNQNYLVVYFLLSFIAYFLVLFVLPRQVFLNTFTESSLVFKLSQCSCILYNEMCLSSNCRTSRWQNFTQMKTESFVSTEEGGKCWHSGLCGLRAEYCAYSTRINAPFSLGQYGYRGLREEWHNVLLCWKDFLETIYLPERIKHKHGLTSIISSSNKQQRIHQTKGRA